MKPLRLALPLFALLLVAIFTPSAGAAGWVTGRALSRPDRDVVSPMIGVTPSGERIVAWQQLLPGSASSTTEGIAVRVAPPGGDYGATQILGDSHAFAPTLATGADDNVAIAWLGDGDKLHIARLTPGASSFTEATPFALVPGARSPLHVAIQGGDVYVAYASEQFGQNELLLTAINAAHLAAGSTTAENLPGAAPGGAIDAASFTELMQPENEVDDPSIAVGGGQVHVAWENLRDSPTTGVDSITTVRRATRPISGGNFSAPITVDLVHSGFRAEQASPRVVASGADARVAWLRGEGHQVAAQSTEPGAPIQTIATTGFPFDLHAKLNHLGTLALAWDQTIDTESAFGVFASKLGATDATGTATRLTQPNTSTQLDDLALGADGSTLVIPDHRNDNIRNSSTEDVQAAFASPGGPFGALEKVTGLQERTGEGAFDSAVAAVGGDGSAIVGWTGIDASGGGLNRFFVSERDATPPAIQNVSVPASAAPGAPVAFAAEASDALSLFTLTWDFGDGSHGRGGLVNHTYGSPGTYTATVTARDDAGNVSSETRTVVIAPPAGPGPDRTPPVVTQLRSANARFRAGTHATASIAAARTKAPAGTIFTLRVDERSTLVLSFKGKAGRHRIVVPGVLVRTRRGPGSVAIPFSGRVGGPRLKPGTYVASVSAIDASGNRSRPATVSFKVVSR